VALIRHLQASIVGITFIGRNHPFAISDRIVVLQRGRNTGERSAAEADGDEIVKPIMGRLESDGSTCLAGNAIS
jgi:ABC-type sugar transport system ATPase subunit